MNEQEKIMQRWREEAITSIPRQLNSLEVDFIKNMPGTPTFSSRVIFKMITDTRRIIVTFGDKVKALEFVRDFVPEKFLPEQYFVAESANEMRDHSLPREFVIKTSHGSGGLIVVSEEADPNARIPDPGIDSDWARLSIHPDNFELEKAIVLLDRWLHLKFRQEEGSIREWCYAEITPRLRVEKLYRGKYLIPEQINVYFFHGKLGSVIFHERTQDTRYPINHRFLAHEENYARILTKMSKETWEELMQCCEQMAQFTDMVRIDWLITNEGPIFSELTNYPGAGYIVFFGTSSRTGLEEELEYCRLWDSVNPVNH
ncbi:MAG: ATP-grasp fold amidoligase family protein [Actinomycetes bacterium]